MKSERIIIDAVLISKLAIRIHRFDVQHIVCIHACMGNMMDAFCSLQVSFLNANGEGGGQKWWNS